MRLRPFYFHEDFPDGRYPDKFSTWIPEDGVPRIPFQKGAAICSALEGWGGRAKPKERAMKIVWNDYGCSALTPEGGAEFVKWHTDRNLGKCRLKPSAELFCFDQALAARDYYFGQKHSPEGIPDDVILDLNKDALLGRMRRIGNTDNMVLLFWGRMIDLFGFGWAGVTHLECYFKIARAVLLEEAFRLGRSSQLPDEAKQEYEAIMQKL